MPHNPRARAGTTILELMVYVALLAVFVVTAADVIINFSNFQTRVQVQNQLQQASRLLMEEFAYAIRHSRSITVLPSSPSDKIRLESETALYTTIKLDPGTQRVLQLEKASIIEEPGDAYYPISIASVNVTGLQFEKIDQSVRITLDMSKNGQSLTAISTFASRQPLN